MYNLSVVKLVRTTNLSTHIKSAACRVALRKSQVIWLKQEMKHLFSRRHNPPRYIKVLDSELSHKLHPIEFDNYMTM